MMIVNQIEYFEKTLPQHLYATDELGFMKNVPREFGIKKRFLQPNNKYNLRWLIYDVDRETATFDWYDRPCPPPNIIATNPENGHAHLFYGLEVPVWRQYGNRDAAFRFACAVDVAMTKALDADPGYAKFISKNPLRSDAWIIQTYQQYSYDLPWMADYLDMEPYQDLRKNLPEVGLGRNCTLFDRLRKWAYKAIRENWISVDFWNYSVDVRAQGYNTQFDHPLPYSEVKATAKSVAKWTWANMSREGFRQWGNNRRNQSIASRRARSLELAKKIQELASLNPQATQHEIANLAGCSAMTVSRALKGRC